MDIKGLFGFGVSGAVGAAQELPAIFPLDFSKTDFVRTDLIAIYTKILTDVAERTSGLSEDQQNTLWDSCLMSDTNKGLITLLAEAMTDQSNLFLYFDTESKMVLQADNKRRAQIEADYKEKAESTAGIFISFQKYKRTDMVRLYSALEYCVVGALHKGVNVSNALQIKIKDLRKSVNLVDSGIAAGQAKAIADALNAGRAVLADAEDKVETAVPQIDPVTKSLEFIDKKRSFYLAMPEAYISGIQTGGMSSTGEQDTKATERGLKSYYLSIFKPTCEALFTDSKTKYKSQDFRQIAQALEAIKTFELVEDQAIITGKEKRLIVSSLLDLEDKE